jgi:hypothetical protein
MQLRQLAEEAEEESSCRSWGCPEEEGEFDPVAGDQGQREYAAAKARHIYQSISYQTGIAISWRYCLARFDMGVEET